MDSPSAKTVLIVDDEKNIRRTLQLILEGEGYHVLTAESSHTALTLLSSPSTSVDVAIFDVKLPDIGGLEVIQRIKKDEATKHIPFLVMSGHATVHDAVVAIKLGASDFIEKPLTRERILVSLHNVLESTRAKNMLKQVSIVEAQRYELLGQSAPMHKLLKDIEKVAPTKASVLITGESGTGKELVSRALHRLSSRAEGPFIRVNCAAIPRELIESELFGHEKGAFTGAQHRKRGLFEQAHRGTLFLDEIGDMDLVAQAKVLRALQSGEILRVGSEQGMHVDVRVLAATNKNLLQEVEKGKFREDLFFRLHVFPIHCPSLRERVEDIPLLAQAFLQAFCRENGTKAKEFHPVVLQALCQRKWPGNVRELKNLVEHMAIVAHDQSIIAELPDSPFFFHQSDLQQESPESLFPQPTEADLPPSSTHLSEPTSAMTLRAFREHAERSYILETLHHCEWNISRASLRLGIERTHLHKKMRQFGIERGKD
ncbi:Fis family transcriptional regulator [Pajaroellobacter abortibovis]|uniref:Fis family transcriptional regulator n=1 Tax=Pajaroellobacter abortibovis TaxID=1882918 RepID=A0A1L6MZA4_9BACT|nr:Fis family transcriptional regulator [Pajaroellobacter abortibovis]